MARDSAIAGTVTMLAHDLRRPFSLLKIGLKMIKSGKDIEDVRRIVTRLEPEIEKSTSKVNAMLRDIMESGREGQMHVEPTSLSALIMSALVDVKRSNSTINVRIGGEICHSHLVVVDAHRVQRVLANLIANAVEATGSAAFIWIDTSVSKPAARLSVTIGNRGSFIPTEMREKLFEQYFTFGKKAGTGLGLTICKRIIEEHGGTIKCASSQVEGTAFTFTLLCAGESEDRPYRIPANLSSVDDGLIGVDVSAPSHPS